MSGNNSHGGTGDYLWASPGPLGGAPDVPGFAQLRLVGSGGSATVYKAVELRHDRPVAIKILDLQAGDSQRRAFAREVDAIARIEPHPNIITLLGSGVTPNGHPYLVFPFFDGGTFAAWVDERGPLTWSAATDIAIKICSAVETVHRAGLIHRDVKPGNVFIGVTPAHPVLGDFGISTSIEGVPTRTVQQAVTVGYTAPEILHDEPATTVSDIYSLGMTIFRIIQGLHAYYAESPAAVMRNVLNQSEAPHLSAGVPPSLDEAVSRALAETPADRPQTALELARRLQAVQADHYLPVTPVLVTGEAGVLGEEPAPTAYRPQPQPVEEEAAVDNQVPSVLKNPWPEVAAPSLLNPITEQGARPLEEASPPAVVVPERPEAGAILAAAVNTNGDSSVDQAAEWPSAESLPTLPTAPPAASHFGSEPESARSTPTEVPDVGLRRPRNLMRSGRPRRTTEQGHRRLPPEGLDQATEARDRVSRAELLAPKVDTRKKPWWKLGRRS